MYSAAMGDMVNMAAGNRAIQDKFRLSDINRRSTVDNFNAQRGAMGMKNLLGIGEMAANIYTGGASGAALGAARTAKKATDQGAPAPGAPVGESKWDNYGVFDSGFWSTSNPNRWYYDDPKSGVIDNWGTDRSAFYTGNK